jgi:hypothetical protein
MFSYLINFTQNDKLKALQVSVIDENPIVAINQCMVIAKIDFGQVKSCERVIDGDALFKSGISVNVNSENISELSNVLMDSLSWYEGMSKSAVIDLNQLRQEVCIVSSELALTVAALARLDLKVLADNQYLRHLSR